MDFKEYEKLDFDIVFEYMNYPKEIWPILTEYFSRYKYEFELSDDEIMEKLNILVTNLESIEIYNDTDSVTLGYYSPKSKKISINLGRLINGNHTIEDILDTIFHELNHVLENTFMKYDYEKKSYKGLALNEIITEMKASRLCMNYIDDDVKKNKLCLDLDGYSNLIFIGTMIHTALGISEKEFLKLADKGRDEFDKEMSKNFLDPKDYHKFMESVIWASDSLHAILYNKKNKEPYTKEDLENLESLYDNIYNSCLYAMQRTIPLKAFETELQFGDLKECVTKCRFNLDKLKINYKEGRKRVLDDEELEIYSENNFLEDLQNRIIAIESISNSNSTITRGELLCFLCDICDTKKNSEFYLDYIETLRYRNR